MNICFGLQKTHGARITSWMSFVFFYLVLCVWTSVEAWSYHYSNHTMDWESARAWCRQDYTDMVAIQNREEISHLNDLLPRQKTYYWIGIRKVNTVWTWVGTNKSLTEEATNWATNEPNNSGNHEDCVEMYVKRATDTGMWNDESCMKKKTALCYTASCQTSSCQNGECVETINSHRCECSEGFYGETCQHVVQCEREEVTIPTKASVSCSHPHGNFSYNSLCQYSCEDGFQLSSSGAMRCTGFGSWSQQPPTCDMIKCRELSAPAMGSMDCSHPLGSFSYGSACAFRCGEGYELVGSESAVLRCEAAGYWNASQPHCVAVQCPDLEDPENGSVDCGVDLEVQFSYGSSCSFRCEEGYRLQGASTTKCTSAAKWTAETPRCTAITCQKPVGGHHLHTQCSPELDELLPGSICGFSCDSGFELQGASSYQCTGEGEWSLEIPICTAVKCPALQKPENGAVHCGEDSQMQFSYGSSCWFSCDVGFELQGTANSQCTSEGSWSSSTPTCKAKQCPPPVAPQRGQVSCPSTSDRTPHPQGSRCTYSCEEGYDLQGALDIECTKSGDWSSTTPTCTVVKCPLLQAPANGALNCSDDQLIFSSQCFVTCTQDHTLHGHDFVTCDRYGNWSGELPICQASPEPLLSPAAIGLAGAGAASLSGLSLAVWLLKRLKQKANKFDLSSNSDIEDPPQHYKNSIDSLI